MFSLQSCPVLCHPMDCSLSGSPVHGILWARIVEWVAKSYSRGYYLPRDQTCNSFVSCIGRQLLYYYCHLDSVQFSSVGQLYLTLCDPMDCSTPGFTAHHQLSELAQTHAIESVMPSNHLILCSPLLLLPSIFPSIRVFSNESVLHIRWPKDWSFSFSISPSNEYSGLISFRMDWLDLLAIQGTLKSLLQYRGSKSSIFRCSAFTVQLSQPPGDPESCSILPIRFSSQLVLNKGSLKIFFKKCSKRCRRCLLASSFYESVFCPRNLFCVVFSKNNERKQNVLRIKAYVSSKNNYHLLSSYSIQGPVLLLI